MMKDGRTSCSDLAGARLASQYRLEYRDRSRPSIFDATFPMNADKCRSRGSDRGSHTRKSVLISSQVYGLT
jgi:hypothetical protein